MTGCTGDGIAFRRMPHRKRDVGMTLAASVIGDFQVMGFDAEGKRKIAGREGIRMPESVGGLHGVF